MRGSPGLNLQNRITVINGGNFISQNGESGCMKDPDFAHESQSNIGSVPSIPAGPTSWMPESR